MHFTHKNLVLILLSVLVVGGAFALAEFRNKSQKNAVYSSNVTAVTDAISSELQELDSDNDGLKDWEEVLLGTDSHRGDTDGDGIKDGKETANPRAIQTTKELSPEDKMARDFFARYMELNKAGLGNDKQSAALLVDEVIKNGIVIETPRDFPLASVKTTPDNSTFALHTYGNQVGEIFKTHVHPPQDEAVITKDSLETEDPELLKQLDPIADYYQTLVRELFKLTVPDSMAHMHLDLINAVNKFLFVTESFKKAYGDPLKGIQGTSLYLKAGDALFTAFRNLSKHFETEKIEFKTFEGGSLFIKKQ